MLHRLPIFGGEASRLAENASEATHQQLIHQPRELTYYLDPSDDTIQKIVCRISNGIILLYGFN